MPSSILFRRSLLILAALSLVLAMGGCSRVKLAYNTADFFIERYADDYLSLEGAQMTRWEPRLEGALAKHRKEELPYLAAFFQGVLAASKTGFNQSNMRCLLDEIEKIYRRHSRIAADTAGPLLADMNRQQVMNLKAKFDEEAEEDQTDNSPESINRINRKRAKRYTESTEWWIGSITKRQQRVIADVTSKFPNTVGEWDRYRTEKRNGLIALLNQHASERRIQTYLTDWLVDYKDLPKSLRHAHPQLRARIAELFIRLDQTFTPDQRTHLQGRMKTLRDNFMDLQQKPHMARVRCGH